MNINSYREGSTDRYKSYIDHYTRKLAKELETNRNRPYAVWYYLDSGVPQNRWAGAGKSEFNPAKTRFKSEQSALVKAAKLRTTGHKVKIRVWDTANEEWRDY